MIEASLFTHQEPPSPFKKVFIHLFFWLHSVWDLPLPGVELGPSALAAGNLSHWIPREVLRNTGILPAIPVSKDATVISNSSAPSVNSLALRAPGKENTCGIWQPLGCSHSLQGALRNSGREKRRILTSDSWDAYERNDFSEPRLSHLSLPRKSLNSLIWDIWFSLINNNCLMFRLPAPYCKAAV